jgi:hypothetical protein
MIAGSGAAEVGPRDHVIQFYDRDEAVTDKAGTFLAEAIHDGGTAVVIATPAHRRAFEDRLAAAGIDVAAARTRGDYLAADAEETLRQFMAGDRPDTAGFEQVVCSLIGEPARLGRIVRVYGELVAVLWETGLVAAAIEVEEMWVGLGRRLPFALWCGYRAGPGAGADATDEICRLHSAVVGSAPAGRGLPGPGTWARELSREFAESLYSVRQARRFVVAALQAGGHEGAVDDAALVVTELAANAVVHARSAFTVTVATGANSIRISVSDCAGLPGTGTGQVLTAKPLHGLGAVAAMAVRWGVAPTPSGKDVWVELPG